MQTELHSCLILKQLNYGKLNVIHTSGFLAQGKRQRKVFMQKGYPSPLTGFVKPNQNLLVMD